MENYQSKTKVKKQAVFALAMMVVLLAIAVNAEATIVEVSVATDKPTYLLSEDIMVFVTAYNPNSEPVTLTFGSTLQASYLMDGVFDWTEDKVFAQVVTQVVIEAYDSAMWDLSHGSSEMAIYPLDVGTHTVIGEVVGYGQSTSVEFEVVPEPATLLIFGLGSLALLRNRRA